MTTPINPRPRTRRITQNRSRGSENALGALQGRHDGCSGRYPPTDLGRARRMDQAGCSRGIRVSCSQACAHRPLKPRPQVAGMIRAAAGCVPFAFSARSRQQTLSSVGRAFPRLHSPAITSTSPASQSWGVASHAQLSPPQGLFALLPHWPGFRFPIACMSQARALPWRGSARWR